MNRTRGSSGYIRLKTQRRAACRRIHVPVFWASAYPGCLGLVPAADPKISQSREGRSSPLGLGVTGLSPGLDSI